MKKGIISAFFSLLLVAGVTAQAKKIDVKKSNLEWVGKKVTGQHNGTVNFKSGTISFAKGKLSGGDFVVNMNSITAKDVEGEMRDKLNGHLKDDDFFGVKKYPTARLVFKTIKSLGGDKYNVKSDLTIKGITKPVSFDVVAKPKNATVKFKVDRTAYGIKYGSGSFFSDLGDKTIDNEFELSANLSY